RIVSCAARRFSLCANSFSIFLVRPRALACPVPKSSYCLERRSHTLFAAHPSEEYSLQYPRLEICVVWCCPLGGSMWVNKKPDARQARQPDPRNLKTNQPTKHAPTAWEDNPAMSTDAMRPLSATADRATA